MEKLSDLLEMAKVSDIITKKEKEDNKTFGHGHFAFKALGSFAQDAGGACVQALFVLDGDVDALHKNLSFFENRCGKLL